jgi:hypothetical protein
MWHAQPTEEYIRRVKLFGKKHPRELQAMLNNLQAYLESLQCGTPLLQIRHGFMHQETHGAIAIDQKGTQGKPRQTRLYVFADRNSETLHLITIGDKSSQRADNNTCREFIVSLRAEEKNVQEKESNNRDGDQGAIDRSRSD